jgi:hypothetical protein
MNRIRALSDTPLLLVHVGAGRVADPISPVAYRESGLTLDA